MRKWALEFLRCPNCGAGVAPTALELNSAGDLQAGILDCVNVQCGAWYPIVRGIPRLLKESLRRGVTRELSDKYGVKRPLEDLQSTASAEGLKTHTIRNFGYEWTKYDRFGWDDPVYNIQYEKTAFFEKSLLQPNDFKDKLVLDAGCGNGRYSYWAAKYGARVIGIDLGGSVEPAGENTSFLDEVQIVQADIFHPPFADSSFDVIFSAGVLMHTGDARKALLSLATKLKPNGVIGVSLYGKGNPIYELVDRTLRRWTTRMSVEELESFTCKAYALRRALEKLGLAKHITRYVRLDPHPHCIFDWYAAPIATHHIYAEVEQWLAEAGLKVTGTGKGALCTRSALRRLLHRFLGSAETIVMKGEARNSCVESRV